ncbi:hypothetical protein QIG52_26780, partial [Klebsiella pneumoniae]|nr:hypothetical protein [Klebsiella pneumoniae]
YRHATIGGAGNSAAFFHAPASKKPKEQKGKDTIGLAKARVSKRGQYDIFRRNRRLPGFSAQITAPAHVIETVDELSY